MEIFDEQYPRKGIGRGFYHMSTSLTWISYQIFERCILYVTLLKSIEILRFW
jgi:hypothetical protein